MGTGPFRDRYQLLLLLQVHKALGRVGPEDSGVYLLLAHFGASMTLLRKGHSREANEVSSGVKHSGFRSKPLISAV